MGRVSGRIGGAGGGAGFALGPTENTFNAATQAAGIIALGVYATANSAWLAQYDANASLMIRVTWPVIPANEAYYARAASAWVNVTPVIVGPIGPKGDQGAVQTGTEIGLALDTLIGDALWRSRLSGVDLVAAVDKAVASTVWRTGHTVLQNAKAIVDALDIYFTNTAWRTGGGVSSGGITVAQATDAAGALLATVDFFSYDTSTNALTLAVPNDYVQPAMLDSSKKSAFRTQIGAEESGAVRPDGSVAFTSVIAGVTPVADADLSTKKYIDDGDAILVGLVTKKASLAGATFTGATGGVAPVSSSDFITKEYADANYSAGATPVGDHTRRVAISTDETLDQSEVDAGTMTTTQTITIPAWSGGRRWLYIGVPEAEGDLIGVSSSGIGIFNAFERVPGVMFAHKWWKTINSQSDVASGAMYQITEV